MSIYPVRNTAPDLQTNPDAPSAPLSASTPTLGPYDRSFVKGRLPQWAQDIYERHFTPPQSPREWNDETKFEGWNANLETPERRSPQVQRILTPPPPRAPSPLLTLNLPKAQLPLESVPSEHVAVIHPKSKALPTSLKDWIQNPPTHLELKTEVNKFQQLLQKTGKRNALNPQEAVLLARYLAVYLVKVSQTEFAESNFNSLIAAVKWSKKRVPELEHLIVTCLPKSLRSANMQDLKMVFHKISQKQAFIEKACEDIENLSDLYPWTYEWVMDQIQNTLNNQSNLSVLLPHLNRHLNTHQKRSQFLDNAMKKLNPNQFQKLALSLIYGEHTAGCFSIYERFHEKLALDPSEQFKMLHHLCIHSSDNAHKISFSLSRVRALFTTILNGLKAAQFKANNSKVYEEVEQVFHKNLADLNNDLASIKSLVIEDTGLPKIEDEPIHPIQRLQATLQDHLSRNQFADAYKLCGPIEADYPLECKNLREHVIHSFSKKIKKFHVPRGITRVIEHYARSVEETRSKEPKSQNAVSSGLSQYSQKKYFLPEYEYFILTEHPSVLPTHIHDFMCSSYTQSAIYAKKLRNESQAFLTSVIHAEQAFKAREEVDLERLGRLCQSILAKEVPVPDPADEVLLSKERSIAEAVNKHLTEGTLKQLLSQPTFNERVITCMRGWIYAVQHFHSLVDDMDKECLLDDEKSTLKKSRFPDGKLSGWSYVAKDFSKTVEKNYEFDSDDDGNLHSRKQNFPDSESPN